MGGKMEKEIYYGHILKGDLLGALDYLKQFSEQADLCARYRAVFARGEYVRYEVDAQLNGILAAYQAYYRDVFYLRVEKKTAADVLRARLAALLGEPEAELSELEQDRLPALFRDRGYRFMGGKTSGYYGPYVWKTTETVSYAVELPDGVQLYTVKLLDGFLCRSWVDHLSFGAIGTGGWTDGDGIINCVKSAWDLDSEAFRVSLLKHEAQHARDLERWPEMSSGDLEYRAKLVELIYSSQRDLLRQFMQEADDADQSNGHSAASGRILRDFSAFAGNRTVSELETEQIRQIAARLLEMDTERRF